MANFPRKSRGIPVALCRTVGLWFTAGRRKCWGEPGRLPGWGAFGRPFRFLDPRAFRIFQRQLELTRQRLDGGTAALPRAFRLEPQIADAPAPRGEDAADGPVVAAIRVILIEPPDDIGRDADERAKRRRGLDAVFPAAPRRAKHHRDLLEVVDEEPLAFFAELRRFPRPAKRITGKQLLQLLRQRRLGDPSAADAKQF